MLRIELHDHEANGEPAPAFATDAEIKIAEALRHRLEEQHPDMSAGTAPLPARSTENR